MLSSPLLDSYESEIPDTRPMKCRKSKRTPKLQVLLRGREPHRRLSVSPSSMSNKIGRSLIPRLWHAISNGLAEREANPRNGNVWRVERVSGAKLHGTVMSAAKSI